MRLGDLFYDLALKAGMSNAQADELRLKGNNVDAAESMVSGWVTGRPDQISKASLLVGAGNVVCDDLGIRIYNDTILTGWLQQKGNWFVGSDLSDPDTTALSIFSIATTYNSESLNAGTLLVGSNSVGKANLRWDPATGQLEFRGGTTVQAYVGTDGVIYFGGGNGKLYSGGIVLYPGATTEQNRSINFFNGTEQLGFLGYVYDTATDVNQMLVYILPKTGVNSWFCATVNAASGQYARTLINDNANNGYNSSIVIHSEDASNYIDFTISAASGIKRFLFYGAPVKGHDGFVCDSGATINEFSIDGLFAGNSDTAVPTEKAVVTYVGAQIAAIPPSSGGGCVVRGLLGI
jgi:hypothetical protein